jgi:acyl-CoA dehydrogenase
MTATRNTELVDLAASIFAAAAASADGAGEGFDARLWKDLEDSGLARLTLPAEVSGSEGELADLAVVLIEAGAAAARVPLVETDLLGGWLAHAAGLAVPAGPLAAAQADLLVERSGTSWVASGTVAKVGWGRSAASVVVLAGDLVVQIDPSSVAVTPGANLADEPRDSMWLDSLVLPADAVAPAPAGAAHEFRLRAALGRSLLIAGATRGALAASVQYAGERVQFGRPIGRFQAVQQQLALAGAEVGAVIAAAEAAALIAASDGFAAPTTAFAVAAAKARAGEAAGAVARVAHQVHGAIGVTREHRLRLLTTRLWSWRDEDGNDAAWQAELGGTVLASGATGLWPLIVGS